MSKSNSSSTPKKWRTDDVESGGESASQTPTSTRRDSHYDELSPAGTFDTALTSPSTFDGSAATPQKITFEHHVKTTPGGSGARGAGLLLGMSKPALAMAALLVLGTSAAAAVGWLQIPGLTGQIEDLEAQVVLLSGEVDRLSAENDRYTRLNNELNQTVEEFRDLNLELNGTVQDLEAIKNEMNATQLELIERIQALKAENEDYSKLNKELKTTASTLNQEVAFFEATLAKLVLENGALSNLTDALEVVTNQVGNITVEQNKTLTGLYDVLSGIKSENDRLEAANTNLETVVSFLNETSVGLGNSLQQITEYLAGQIVANRVLATESLENTFRQRIQTWDCDYRDQFRDEVYGQNFTASISDISTVIDYVDQRIMSELCLDKSDFEDYLLTSFPQELTSFRLLQAVNNYTTAALDYYFPEDGESGVTPEEWNDASFDCQNLKNDYTWRSNDVTIRR